MHLVEHTGFLSSCRQVPSAIYMLSDMFYLNTFATFALMFFLFLLPNCDACLSCGLWNDLFFFACVRRICYDLAQNDRKSVRNWNCGSDMKFSIANCARRELRVYNLCVLLYLIDIVFVFSQIFGNVCNYIIYTKLYINT